MLVASLAACSPLSSPPDGSPGTSPDGGVGTSDGGTGSGGTGSDAGPVADAGSDNGGGAQDAGQGGGSGGNNQGGGGGGGGNVGSDCDGLVPAAPGAATEFRWSERDLREGTCDAAATDGTGHIALTWQHHFQPGDTKLAFIDPSNNSQAGSYGGTVLRFFGKASGFIGGDCQGSNCVQQRFVLDPVGHEVYASEHDSNAAGLQADDATSGMIQIRQPNMADGGSGILLDAIDESGAIRWTRALDGAFRLSGTRSVIVAVDRKGNVLAISSSQNRFAAGAWAGQWFDRDGNAGPVFEAVPPGLFVAQLYERVGDGLFVNGVAADGSPGWIGQFDAQATVMSPPPDWLAARPRTTLHMVHGGTGYAVLPNPENNAACEQKVDVISPSGQFCGSSTFSIGGGACTTSSIIVGWDGTVVQQGPRDRESCSAADHVCTCTYRYWSGYFRG